MSMTTAQWSVECALIRTLKQQYGEAKKLAAAAEAKVYEYIAEIFPAGTSVDHRVHGRLLVSYTKGENVAGFHPGSNTCNIYHYSELKPVTT